MTRTYLSSIIDDHTDGWKIQLTMEISFVSVIKNSDGGFNEQYTVHLLSEDSSAFIGYATDNIIEELFNSLLEE